MKHTYLVDGIYFDEDGNAVYIPELEGHSAKTLSEAKKICGDMLMGKIKSTDKCTHVYIWEQDAEEEMTGKSWLCNLTPDGKKIEAYS